MGPHDLRAGSGCKLESKRPWDDARDRAMVSAGADPDGVEDPGGPAKSPGRGWWTSWVLGLLLWVVYSSGSQYLGTIDTIATTLLPLAIVRGDGLALDRFRPVLREGPLLAPYVVRSHGRIISRYPVAPALLIVPL